MMKFESLQKLIEHSMENEIIDAHAIDQDGSNVFVVGDSIHYLSDERARGFLMTLMEDSKTSRTHQDCESLTHMPVTA